LSDTKKHGDVANFPLAGLNLRNIRLIEAENLSEVGLTQLALPAVFPE
jgi:hypothetical protein